MDSTDTDAEIEIVKRHAIDAGAKYAICCDHWARGGLGALDLANAVVDVCKNEKSDFRFLYDENDSIVDKITMIAKEMYGADGIELSELALKKIEQYEKQVLIVCLFLIFRDSRRFLFVWLKLT